MTGFDRATAPVDPDVDLPVASQHSGRAVDPLVLSVIAAGGVIGAEARYALERWWPAPDGGWPVATFVINVSGSLLLGALMALLAVLSSPHRLTRPFVGVGILGGFTTFSTAMVEVPALMDAGRPGLALSYLVSTAPAALLAAAAGAFAVRAVSGRRGHGRRRR